MRIGQKVKGVRFPRKEFDRYNPHDLPGKVISNDGKYNPIIVEWSNGIRNSYTENELEKCFD